MKASTVAARIGVSVESIEGFPAQRTKLIVGKETFLVERGRAPQNSDEAHFYTYLSLSDDRFQTFSLPPNNAFWFDVLQNKLKPLHAKTTKQEVRQAWELFCQDVLTEMDWRDVSEETFGDLRNAIRMNDWAMASRIALECQDKNTRHAMIEYIKTAAHKQHTLIQNTLDTLTSMDNPSK